MPKERSDLVQGTLDMLILKTLALEPMHGYGITVRLEQMRRLPFESMQARYLLLCSGCSELG
jgi:PadR family transcriptional regulator, regulatory protein PadR